MRISCPRLEPIDLDALIASLPGDPGDWSATWDGTRVTVEGGDEPFDLLSYVNAISPPRQAAYEAVRQLARDVWAGTDSFTNAQAQRLIAGLVLRELKE